MASTYTNPVYPASLPDPFVLKHRGEYWAYGSERSADGRYFKILHSLDLVSWEEVGGALDEQPGGFDCYWAPEVSYWNGLFYLYYSLGDEAHMSIRVATCASPVGPFIDQGLSLIHEPFAIDAHVFEDEDGKRYLFYATDYLEHTHIGTGTAVDRLVDPFTLAGEPRPVTRAMYSWQVYDPERAEKGGVCWHTLEGPFVLKHKGQYYQLFSGGNWHNDSYGISYGVTTNLDQPAEWEQACDGEVTLPILRSNREQGVVGPGHNSVVRGPDNRQLYCVYHRWMPTSSGMQRVMAIDRMSFVGERLVILGPTSTPQPAPTQPTRAFFCPPADHPILQPVPPWQLFSGGRTDSAAAPFPQASPQGDHLQLDASRPQAAWDVPFPDFTLELTLHPTKLTNAQSQESGSGGGSGLELATAAGEALRLLLQPAGIRLVVAKHSENNVRGERSETHPLPAGFVFQADHLLRVEVNHLCTRISLDGSMFRWHGHLAEPPTRLSLRSVGVETSFYALQYTAGWEENFDCPQADLSLLGWVEPLPIRAWKIEHQLLQAHPDGKQPVLIRKVMPGGDYELVLNARLDADSQLDAGYGFGTLAADVEAQPQFSLRRNGQAWVLENAEGRAEIQLPQGFDPGQMQQFCLRQVGEEVSVFWQDRLLASCPAHPGARWVGLSSRGTRAWFDLVRLTVLRTKL